MILPRCCTPEVNLFLKNIREELPGKICVTPYQDKCPMTHEYSVEIQNYISEKLVQVTKKKKEAEEKNDFESLQFYIGQEEELFTLRQYLTEKIDLNTQQYY